MHRGIALVSLASLIVAALPVQAAEVKGQCPVMSVAISYKMSADSAIKVKEQFDQKIHALEEFIKAQNIHVFNLQSMNMNILADQGNPMARLANNNVPPPTQFRLSGSAEYQTNSSDNAFKVGNFLTQQKFDVTVSNKTGRTLPCAEGSVAAQPVMPTIAQPAPPAAPAQPVPPVSTPRQPGAAPTR